MSDKLNQDAAKLREFWVYEPTNKRKGAITYVREATGRFKDIPQTPQSYWLREPAFKVIEYSAVAEFNAEIVRLKEQLWAAEGRVKGMVEGLEILKGDV